MNLFGKLSFYTTSSSLKYLLENYFDPATFLAACNRCNAYGKTWCCPPYDFNPYNYIKLYDRALLIGIKVSLKDENILLAENKKIVQIIKKDFENKYLKLENQCSGLLLTITGKCLGCGDAPCSRIDNKPCRNKNMARPSLESFGFNVAAICEDFFNHKLQWSTNGKLPDTMFFVGALLTKTT